MYTYYIMQFVQWESRRIDRNGHRQKPNEKLTPSARPTHLCSPVKPFYYSLGVRYMVYGIKSCNNEYNII